MIEKTDLDPITLLKVITPPSDEPFNSIDLNNGLQTKIGPHLVTLRYQTCNLYQNVELRGIYAYVPQYRTDIAEVDVEVDVITKPKLGRNLGKYYSEEDLAAKLRGNGLITLMMSLLFNVLQKQGVEHVEGEIDATNTRALENRLKTPDLINGGYYPTEISIHSSAKKQLMLKVVSTLLPQNRSTTSK